MDTFEEFSDLNNKSILVVDDNPTNLRMITTALDRDGFTTLVARDGISGIKKAKYAHPDLILLDVMMPGIDGFKTCHCLKANAGTADIPIIFMTALSNTEDKVRGFECGGVDYITKPLHHEEVIARITTHLRLRDLNQRLQKANGELTRLNANKDKFFSIVAHDLKGPFAPIIGNVDLLLERWDYFGAEEKQEMVGTIKRSAHRVLALLETLLQWSRMQRSRIECFPEMLPLFKIAHANIYLLSDAAAGKSITLKNSIPNDAIVYADKNMAHTILRNLISNAIKYTPREGSITVSSAPSAKKEESTEFVEISVSDTGIGISQEDQEKLFRIETHHTTLGTEKEKGTGLGLIICKDMVEKNGGTIRVTSRPKKGTTFSFTLPKGNLPSYT